MATFDLPRSADWTARLVALPGVRTLRNQGFRELAAVALIIIGVVRLTHLMATQAADPLGQFSIDFGDYYGAATSLATGKGAYAPALLAGPVDSQGIGVYRYPPVFAQLLIPLTALPVRTAALVWLGIQAALIFLSAWLAGSLSGARASFERFLWTAVACVYFLPVFDSLWKGNVSGVVAFQVALLIGGGFAGGLALATAVLLKVSPVTLVPPLFLGRFAWSERGATAARRAAVVGLVSIAFVSFAVTSRAWVDYARVFPNLLGGFVDYPTNLAPASLIVSRAPSLASLAPVVRLLTTVLALGAAVLAVWLARRETGWPAAVTAGVAAMLFLPASIWYHYLVVLLPLGAFAWPRASAAARAFLACGAVLVYAGFAWWLPLATPGSLLMLATVLAVVWPKSLATPGSNRGTGDPFVPVWIRRTVHPGSPIAPGPRPGIDS